MRLTPRFLEKLELKKSSLEKEDLILPNQESNKKLKLSIVTPCFNEADNILECYETTKVTLHKHLAEFDYEHIFCDNASTDGTSQILEELASKDKNVKVILNSRNFGPFNSMFNGLMASSGDLVIPFLPADLQDPPDVIPEFVEQWRNGFEVVYGVRKTREESILLRGFRRIYYRLVNRWASIPIPENVGEFTLIVKQVVDSLREVDDYYPYVRGLIANAGFRSTSVPYTWKARKKGISKNNAYALIDQALNGIISFTNIPLRLLMFSGIILSALSLGYSLVTLITVILGSGKVAQPGIQTLIVAVFFFSGVILFALGLMGEYLAAIHSQVRKRPLVIERKRINF